MSGARPPVFVDTHAFLAVLNADEEHHDQAVALFEELDRDRTVTFTSDWVFAELLSFCSRKPLRSSASRMVLDLRQSGALTILPATRKSFDEAFQLFRSRLDKSWSLTDCSSLTICNQHGIRRVMTHDHHFVQAGLEILLP